MLGWLLLAFVAVPGCAVWKSYGPYSGTVEEVGTGRPIEGAAILAVYKTEGLTPAGRVSSYLDAWETVSGADGRFLVPTRFLFTLRPINVWEEGPSIYVFKPGFRCYPERGGTASVRADGGFAAWGKWPLPEGRELKISLPPVTQAKDISDISACGPSDCPVGVSNGYSVPYDKMRHFLKLRHMELVRSGARGKYVYDVETDLFLAVEGNDRPHVGRLLEAGADVDARNAAAYSPLMLAAERGRPEIAALLIRKGAKVNGTDADGKSPLVFALSYRQEETARILLEHGADPNLPTSAGSTPLMAAAITGNEGLVRTLLQRGARVDARTVDGTTPLHYAAAHLPIVKVLLDHGAAVNDRDRGGRTVFMFTLAWSQDPGNTAAIARFLLSRGWDPKLSTRGVTPLFQALQSRQWEAAEVLIDAGGDVNAAPLNGYTPLMMVAWRADGSPVLAGKLLAQGARIDAADSNGDTALLMAIRAGNLAVAQFLVARGADVNRRNKARESPLGLANAKGLAGFAAVLTERGARE